MDDIKNNPIIAFINERIIQFKNESLRLQDKTPLVEYKTLIDTFFLVIHKLGTVEHEVALAYLSQEYKRATSEAAQAWREIWREFFEGRKSNIELARHFARLNAETASRISKAEETLKDMELHIPHDEEMIRSRQEVHESAHEVIAAAKSMTGKDFSKGWRTHHWVLLWANLHIYTVYVRYFLARLSFFALRHSFIIIVSIVICGIVYSKMAKFLTIYLSKLAPGLPWTVGLFIIFGAAMLKKYYIDPKVKRWQVKLETRWLLRVAVQLHGVRTLALLSRTQARRMPKSRLAVSSKS